MLAWTPAMNIKQVLLVSAVTVEQLYAGGAAE